MSTEIKPPVKKKRGRQPPADPKKHYKYTEDMAAEFCAFIAEGGSFTNFCKEKNNPSYSVVCAWRKHIPEFETAFWTAKKEAAEAIYAEIQEIERRMTLPATVPEIDIFGEPERDTRNNRILTKPNPDFIAPHAGKSLINSLQWRAEKTDPDKYGQKVHVQTEDLTLQNRIIEARERIRSARLIDVTADE